MRPVSAFTNRTEQPRHQVGSRPLSALTRKNIAVLSQRKHHDTINGVPKVGRGLGFFGDDNDRIRNATEKRANESKLKVGEKRASTNAEG